MNNNYEPLRENRGWLIALGIITILLGLVAIAIPFTTTLAVAILLGWIFLISGIVQIVQGFKSWGTGGFLLKLLLGILYIIVGIMLLQNLLPGVITLTLAVGIVIFSDGVFRVFQAFLLRPATIWGMVLVNGMVNIILSIFIWSQWSFNAPWLTGLFVGISLCLNGAIALMLPLAKENN